MISFEPIGIFHSRASYKYEVPRQGVFFKGHPGRIDFSPHKNFEEALRDLEGFERIWLIFVFDKNEGWRPMARPPVPPLNRDRVGVFASRSPYRPNPVGLSCVKLLKIEGLSLFVDEADLLDGSPILDIKPYIPKADAFPDAKAGWVDSQSQEAWKIFASEEFKKESDWIAEACGLDILSFAECQLMNSPFDSSRRRVKVDARNQKAELAFRTFRLDFSFDASKRDITLLQIRSGYSAEELASSEDPYSDKELHLAFLSHFAQVPNA
ncbi:MAG: tRNA (N6-threonylcarbamoyladenosine(37)-N6)-methyltransferase TrmO [Fibrobacteraceae bacterium]